MTKPARASPTRCRAPERLDDVLLDRLLIKRGEHLSLFTAPAALERDYDAVPEAYEAVIDAVRQSTPLRDHRPAACLDALDQEPA